MNKHRQPWSGDIAVDGNDRVVSWGADAEGLLGYSAPSIVGRRLQEVLDGRDVFGNRVCPDACWLREMLRRGEAVNHFELDVRHAQGHRVRVIMEAEPVEAGRTRGWTYRLLPDRRRASSPPASQPGPAAPLPRFDLTKRQRDVLRLLAKGAATQEIARDLGISATTARNHIQHLIEKLGAHNRLQAVSVALQHNLF